MVKPWPFGALRMFGYGAILIDPPWHYEMYSEKGEARSPQAHYQTMTDQNILDLPVGHLGRDQTILMLWATWAKLPLAVECVKCWGFKYISGGDWVKTTKDGTALKIGLGYNFRNASEPFLLARMGDSQARLTNVPNVIIAPAREHSRKPDEMREIVTRLSPNQNRCELFAREPWADNEVWGNDVAKFESVK